MDWRNSRRGKWGVGKVRLVALIHYCTMRKLILIIRWYAKHPLHLSSAAVPATPPTTASSPATPTRTFSHGSSSRKVTTISNTSSSLAASVLAADPPESSPHSSFTTALSMLLYDVSYLAYTQSVEVPLSQAGDVLSNLWMVCCSAELGRSETILSQKHLY